MYLIMLVMHHFVHRVLMSTQISLTISQPILQCYMGRLNSIFCCIPKVSNLIGPCTNNFLLHLVQNSAFNIFKQIWIFLTHLPEMWNGIDIWLFSRRIYYNIPRIHYFFHYHTRLHHFSIFDLYLFLPYRGFNLTPHILYYVIPTN